jgi:hypothetical protein
MKSKKSAVKPKGYQRSHQEKRDDDVMNVRSKPTNATSSLGTLD